MKKTSANATRYIHGPLGKVFEKLSEKGQSEEVTSYLHGLHDVMKGVAHVKPPKDQRFYQPDIGKTQLDELDALSKVVVQGLAKDIEKQGLSSKEVEKLRKQAKEKVLGFLSASPEEMAYRRDVLVPLNLSALPVMAVSANALLMHDSAMSSLIFMSPLPLAFGDQTVSKVLIISGIILAIISWLLALLNVKVPDMKAEKLTNSVQRALRSPSVRQAFLNMMETIKRAGATLKDKIAEVFKFMKVLYDNGSFSVMLKEVLKGLSYADIFITITAIILLILSGGASAAAKAAFATAVFILAMINLGRGYYKSQEGL